MTTPPLHPFPYDAFQRRALAVIDRDVSLFVAAPTGAGKTVLADYVIERTLANHQRVIYTAPIKALSNQKFRDFTARHGEDVGIMTGDVTIQPTAPLVIMTTEIYRNTLLEDVERLSRYAWVIFDEIHYLDDPERGTVWEESLLFTPPHIKLLCLSATIPNVAQLAQWIRTVHQRPVEVVEETQRPVPLAIFFQAQNRIVDSLEALKQHAYRPHAGWPPHHGRSPHGRRPPGLPHVNRVSTLVTHLRQAQQLPCIFFTFGRRRAEDLAWEIAGLPLLEEAERAPLQTMFEELCAHFGLTQDRTAEALSRLIARGVAYHHAGMLPTMKEVVERCFTSRRLPLIVTTETFALGINMPARSIVLDTVKKRSGGGFALLRRRDFLQMAGRAGRRGMDAAGFVYLRVNPSHVSYPELQRLLQAEPEAVESRFNTAYATLLNLYRRHGPSLVEVFPRTLYYFQTSGARRQAGLELMQRKLDLLAAMGYVIPPPAASPKATLGDSAESRRIAAAAAGDGTLTAKGEFASWLYGYELLLTELHSRGRLRDLDAVTLAVLMVAIVYEPRPGTAPPKRHRMSKRLAALCAEPLARIHREETRWHIAPKSKAPAFHLSHAMEAWMHRTPFARLIRYCDADDGEIVRYFRMAIQILRQLSEAPGAEATLRAAAEHACGRINRDVIDAEAQLRMG